MLVTQKEALKAAWDKHEVNLDRPIGLYGLDWGHHDWNMVTGGALPGTITSLAAGSGTGKSATLIQVMKAAAAPGPLMGDITFFTWEMSAIGNVERYACHQAGVTMQEYRYARILPELKKEAIHRAYSEGKDFPVVYHQTSTDIDSVLRVCEDRRKIILGKELELGVKIQQTIIIDYVSLATAKQGRGYGSKTYDIGDFMKTFKQEANLKGYAGLFLAQIKRDTEGEPNESHIQDSGAYYQNSDNVIIMHRPENAMLKEIRDPDTDQMVSSKDRVMWRFRKARDGNPQDVIGHCDMRYFRFWSRHHIYGFDYNKLYTNEDFWRQEYAL